VTRFACSRWRHFLQIGRQVRLLKRSQADTSVDAVLGVLQNALVAVKILRCENILRIVSQLLVAKVAREAGKTCGKRRIGFLPGIFGARLGCTGNGSYEDEGT
jgi:hypothetical protein